MVGGGTETPLHPERRVAHWVRRLLVGAGCIIVLLTLPSTGNGGSSGDNGGNHGIAYEEGSPEGGTGGGTEEGPVEKVGAAGETAGDGTNDGTGVGAARDETGDGTNGETAGDETGDGTNEEAPYENDEDIIEENAGQPPEETDPEGTWDLDHDAGETGEPSDAEWDLDQDAAPEVIPETIPETIKDDEDAEWDLDQKTGEDADAEWDLGENSDDGDSVDNGDSAETGETGTGNDQGDPGGPEEDPLDEPVDEPLTDTGDEDPAPEAIKEDAEWDLDQGQDPDSPDNKGSLDNAENRDLGELGDEGGIGDESAAGALTFEDPPVEDVVEPYLIKPLVNITTGRNDSNPAWSPTGDMIAFERSIEGKKEIHVTSSDGTPVTRIYYKQSNGDEEFDFFLPGIIEEVSYNAGVSWSPEGGRFVFMSNGGTGNYDIYLRTLGDGSTKRLTRDEAKEGQARWSPVADQLVFVSGRTGKAELYLMDLVSGETVRLTNGEKSYLYPRWSPDGKSIAMIYGSNENHDIRVIGDISRPAETTRDLTIWAYDDLSPVWSPDGKKIAFYTNYNADDDQKVWSLAVVDSGATGPASTPELAERVVARNVVPDIETGPAWLPDGKGLIYVRNDEKSYNPIYIVNLEDGTERRVTTGTRINHDVTVSSPGTVAYRAQSEQWDHIYLLRLNK